MDTPTPAIDQVSRAAAAADHALTIALLQCGRFVALEGAPCVGKSSLVASIGAAFRELGVAAVCHAEREDQHALDRFLDDPPAHAAWFQLFKLRGRELTLADVDHATARDMRCIHVVDRSLAGDYAFAIHHEEHTKFIDPVGAATYRAELALIREKKLPAYAPPLLCIYLVAPPPVCVDRVKRRGKPGEIKHYDEKFFVDMDRAHREAFARLGVPYVTVDWSEEHAGGKVPPERCLALLTHALREAYGKNWAALTSK